MMKHTIAEISTLVVTTEKPALDYYETAYLHALEYTINSFESIDDREYNNFCLYLSKGTFLIANHDINRKINPFAFVNEKGEIFFEVDISIFASVIDDFKGYISFCKNRNSDLPQEKILQRAIKDYKNDCLDFYSNSRVVDKELVNRIRDQYEDDDIDPMLQSSDPRWQ